MSDQNSTIDISKVVAEYNRRISALTEELVLRIMERDIALEKLSIIEPQLTELLAAREPALDDSLSEAQPEPVKAVPVD